MKKVLIIAPDYMGYMEKVGHHLRKTKGIEVIDIHIPAYKYPSVFTKISNFFLKRLGQDVKFDYREKYIKDIIGNQTFDVTLIVRPDHLSESTLLQLKSQSLHFKSYFYDGVHRFPKKLKSVPYFDKIFSFEPSDCEEFGFELITNFIYDEQPLVTPAPEFKYSVFNISSHDRQRFPLLLKIANSIKQQSLTSKIIIKTNKKINDEGLVTLINKPMSLMEIKELLQQSACMLDLGVIQKHRGLTFRVFEAMGLHKKIITNNPDIAHYDFYDPQNILIIDEESLALPKTFLTSAYRPIPEHIYQKYTLDSWVKRVFAEVL